MTAPSDPLFCPLGLDALSGDTLQPWSDSLLDLLADGESEECLLETPVITSPLQEPSDYMSALFHAPSPLMATTISTQTGDWSYLPSTLEDEDQPQSPLADRQEVNPSPSTPAACRRRFGGNRVPRGRGCLLLAYAPDHRMAILRSRTDHANDVVRRVGRYRSTYSGLTLLCFRTHLVDVEEARRQFQRLVHAGLLAKSSGGQTVYRLGTGVTRDQLEAAVRRHLTAGEDGLNRAAWDRFSGQEER